MRRFWPGSEIELGVPVRAWLESRGWTVYAEVQPKNYGPIADMVATRGPQVWVIELKTRFGLAVIDQALGWVGTAHRVSIATPQIRNVSASGCRLLRDAGIGWIVAGADWESVREEINPRLRSRVQIGRWRSRLAEIARAPGIAPAAGSPSGAGRWTPFRQTCYDLERYVAQHPGCLLKDAVAGITHHYSSGASARGSLRDWIDAGRMPTVTLRVVERQTRLYPSADTLSSTR